MKLGFWSSNPAALGALLKIGKDGESPGNAFKVRRDECHQDHQQRRREKGSRKERLCESLSCQNGKMSIVRRPCRKPSSPGQGPMTKFARALGAKKVWRVFIWKEFA